MSEGTKKARLLVIDDEKGFTHMLKINLERSGEFEVFTENSGRKGLAAAKNLKPDIIFLDIIMPDLPGNQVAAQIEADPEISRIPIVFVTALVSKNEVVTDSCTISGRPFLAKPINVDDARDCIRRELAPKVLIIDDDKDLARLTSGRLKSAGFRVWHASTGEEGMQLLESEMPDLVILDLILPGQSGWQIAHKLRSEKQFQHIKIIMLSGMIEQDGEAEGVLEEADYFMPKPYDGAKLADKVKDLLNNA